MIGRTAYVRTVGNPYMLPTAKVAATGNTTRAAIHRTKTRSGCLSAAFQRARGDRGDCRSAGAVVLVQVAAVVAGQLAQPWQVLNLDTALAEGEQSALAQLTQGTVDVDRAEAE